jgi:hypothetical protein
VLPKGLVDISLFTDLLPYVLPAGMTCRIARADQVPKTYTTKVAYSDTMQAALVPDLGWDSDEQQSTGLASIFEPNTQEPTFASYLDNGLVNAGLLDNSIIPMITDANSNVALVDDKSVIDD